MARPRKGDFKAELRPIVEDFVERIAQLMQTRARDEMRGKLEVLLEETPPIATKGTRGRKGPRKAKPCRVPDCGKPSKGPRFNFFCADHWELPAEEKAKIVAADKAAKKAAKASGRTGGEQAGSGEGAAANGTKPAAKRAATKKVGNAKKRRKSAKS
ncbi:MAG: hypothetical protein WC526_00795 [Patescibacteria group bacterium]